MSDKREDAKSTASSLLGPTTDTAPKAPTTRAQKEDQAKRWGKPMVARVRPETRRAVDDAVKQYNVQKGQFVDFLLSYSLLSLQAGKITLPVEESSPQRLKLPPLT
jgi:hypothetical protein